MEDLILPPKFYRNTFAIVNEKAKQIVVTVIKFALSVAILIYLYNKARVDPSFDEFLNAPKRWGWISLAFIACLAAFMFGFIRWRVMVRALDLPFTFLDAIRIGFIGLFFNLFAFGVIGGDTLRAFYVTRQLRDRIPEAISSVVADRVIGLLTMFSVASTAFLLLNTSGIEPRDPNDLVTLTFICRIVLVFTVLGWLGVLMLFCAPWIANTRWYQSLLQIPKAGSILKTLTDVALMYRSRPSAVVISVLLSIAVNVAFLVTIYSMAAGLTTGHPTMGNHFVIEPIAMVGNAVPLPGGVGGMEWAMSFLYDAFGSGAGVIVAFAFRFAILCVSGVGAIFWFLNRSQVSGLVTSEESQDLDAKTGAPSPVAS